MPPCQGMIPELTAAMMRRVFYIGTGLGELCQIAGDFSSDETDAGVYTD